MQLLKILPLVFAISLLTQCTYLERVHEQNFNPNTRPTATPLVIDTELYDRGIAVYLSNYCGICHQLDAAETHGTFGPAHNRMGLVATERMLDPNYHGGASTPAEYIRESLLDPEVYFVPGFEASPHRMPAFTHLSAEDIDAMVYMLSLQQDTPPTE